MKNTPLTSNEQSKIMIFILLFLPAVFFGVGILPAFFLIFGFFMMKRNEDFGNIEIAVRNFKVYTTIVALVFAAFTIFAAYDYATSESYYKRISMVLAGLTLFAVAYAHFILIDALFLRPLIAHKEWVVVNGVFSSKPKSSKINNTFEAEIIKGEKSKTYSVADELIKWAQLKEGGHISEQQYDYAKNKLLKRG